MSNLKSKVAKLGLELVGIFWSYLKTYLIAAAGFTVVFFFYAGIKRNMGVQIVSAILASLLTLCLAAIAFSVVRKYFKKYYAKARWENVDANDAHDVIDADFVEVDDRGVVIIEQLTKQFAANAQSSDIDVSELLAKLKESRRAVLVSLRELERLKENETSAIQKKELEELIRNQREYLISVFRPASSKIGFVVIELAKRVIALTR